MLKDRTEKYKILLLHCQEESSKVRERNCYFKLRTENFDSFVQFMQYTIIAITGIWSLECIRIKNVRIQMLDRCVRTPTQEND